MAERWQREMRKISKRRLGDHRRWMRQAMLWWEEHRGKLKRKPGGPWVTSLEDALTRIFAVLGEAEAAHREEQTMSEDHDKRAAEMHDSMLLASDGEESSGNARAAAIAIGAAELRRASAEGEARGKASTTTDRVAFEAFRSAHGCLVEEVDSLGLQLKTEPVRSYEDGVRDGLDLAERCAREAFLAGGAGVADTIAERIRGLRTTPAEPARSYEDGVRDGLARTVGYYHCEEHGHEQTEPCPDCALKAVPRG